MTPAQIAKLTVELKTDPLALGYATALPDAGGANSARLNAMSTTLTKTRFVTARTILAECDGGGSLLKALERAAIPPTAATAQQIEVSAATESALKFLNQDSGLDAGNPGTIYLINVLTAIALLTPAQGAALKQLAVTPASRAEVLGIGPVASSDITAALFNDNGSAK